MRSEDHSYKKINIKVFYWHTGPGLRLGVHTCSRQVTCSSSSLCLVRACSTSQPEAVEPVPKPVPLAQYSCCSSLVPPPWLLDTVGWRPTQTRHWGQHIFLNYWLIIYSTSWYVKDKSETSLHLGSIANWVPTKLWKYHSVSHVVKLNHWGITFVLKGIHSNCMCLLVFYVHVLLTEMHCNNITTRPKPSFASRDRKLETFCIESMWWWCQMWWVSCNSQQGLT